MRKIIFTLTIIICSTFIYGQSTDSISKNKAPKHIITINPLNAFVFQQAGLTYEFKAKRLGIGISTGYFYPNKLNISRFFIAGTNEQGAYEFYSGVYATPQLKFYVINPETRDDEIFCYITLKGVYKSLKVDSNAYHIWDTGSGDDSFYYRKQIDKCKITGAFLGFGFTRVINHFVFDFNFGAGYLGSVHNLIIAGEGCNITVDSFTNVKPSRQETYRERHFTTSLSVGLGYAF